MHPKPKSSHAVPARPPVPDTNLVASKFECEGRTHLFQIPPHGAKGTVVFLHGCARKAEGFWPKSPKNPDCLGFPEDVSHTKQILAKGYAVFVPTPIDLRVLGWSFGAGDHEQLAIVVTKFLEAHDLVKKPVFFGGGSAGGGMAVRLPGVLQSKHVPWTISGIIAEVATNQDVPDSAKDFPPVVYIVMQRDPGSQVEAKQRVASLAKAKIRGAMHISPIRTVYPDYFSDRIPGVNKTTSRHLVEAMHHTGLLDAQGHLTKDPKDTDQWVPALKKLIPTIGGASGPFTLVTRTSPFIQALTVAYAQHEHVADFTTAALTWLESGGDFGKMAESMAVSKPTSFHVKF